MSAVPPAPPVSPRPGRRSRIGAAAALAAAVVAAFASWLLPPRPAAAPGPAEVWTIASWNMEWFPSGYPEPRPAKDEARRLRAAARALRAGGVPDVLLVQEIRDAETCSNLLARLGDPSMRLAVCSDFWFDATNRGRQQLAVFTRLPVVAAGFEPWRASDFVYPPRGFAWAVVEAPGGRTAVFDVHLKSNYVPEDKDEARQAVLNRLKRELAARQLLGRMEDIAAAFAAPGAGAAARIVAGDFNTALEDPRFEKEKTLRLFLEAGYRDAFGDVPEARRPTLPADDRYPAATFDHAYFAGLPDPLRAEVGPDTPVSDHRAIRFAFPRGPAPLPAPSAEPAESSEPRPAP